LLDIVHFAGFERRYIVMLRRTAFLALPAALLGVGVLSQARAQTIVTGPVATGPVELAQSTVIVAPSAPPPPQTETIPPPPSASYYWTPGHWSWNGASWVWADGTYVQRPNPTATWVPGQWMQQSTGGYTWVAGHWAS
jgi:hypothetical protein